MKIKTANRFEKDFDDLSEDVKRRVIKKLGMFQQNPKHPSLRTKPVKGTKVVWEFTTSDDYRVTFQRDGADVILRRVGTHRILRNP